MCKGMSTITLWQEWDDRVLSIFKVDCHFFEYCKIGEKRNVNIWNIIKSGCWCFNYFESGM